MVPMLFRYSSQPYFTYCNSQFLKKKMTSMLIGELTIQDLPTTLVIIAIFGNLPRGNRMLLYLKIVTSCQFRDAFFLAAYLSSSLITRRNHDLFDTNPCQMGRKLVLQKHWFP
jgi:hypothetical protein